MKNRNGKQHTGWERGVPRRTNLHKKIFVVLLVLVLFLASLDLAKARGWLIPEQPHLEIMDGVVRLDSMTLEQKIAQMIIVGGVIDNFPAWRNLQVGGVHLFAMQNEWIYNNTIIDLQYGMPIPFFITADLEGCISPFGNIRTFSANAEIMTVGAAFEKGFKEGEFLQHLGFNLNFAPVVDLEDQIWKCRAFPGGKNEVAQLAESYLLGLQTQGVTGTIKHYPGKTLVVKDPHQFIVAATIDDQDTYPYHYLLEKGDVRAVMVSHIISSGTVDSAGVPAVVSPNAIGELKQNFEGLIVSDEIHMLGLKNYFNATDAMYIALFKAGNDLVLNFDKDPNEIYRMIQVIKAAVEREEISERQIEASVTKILQTKGFKVQV